MILDEVDGGSHWIDAIIEPSQSGIPVFPDMGEPSEEERQREFLIAGEPGHRMVEFLGPDLAFRLAGSPEHRRSEFFDSDIYGVYKYASHVTAATLNPAPEPAPAQTAPTTVSWLDSILLPSEPSPVARPTSFGSLTRMNAPTLSTVVTNELVDGEPVDAPALPPIVMLAIVAAIAYWLLD